MSWNAYITSYLEGAGKGHGGAIIGLNGGIWAYSANFVPSQAEATAIAGAVSSNITGLQTSGVTIGGVKYLVNRVDADDGLAMGKKGAAGISIYKTNQAIIVGYYADASVSAGQNSDATFKCADYLKQSGY
ncbi:Profilin-1 [Entamoeba marina]